MCHRFIAALGFLATSLMANATPVTFSTTTSDSIAVCVVGATACDHTVRISPANFGGYPGSPSASTSVSMAGYGSALSTVSLSGQIGAPVFSASATSDLGARANTTSAALQSYTYTGTTIATRTFEATLSYSQLVTGAYPNPGPGGGIFSTINIFSLSTPTIDAGTTPASNFGVVLAPFISPASLPGYVDLGSATFEDLNTNPAGLGAFGVTLTLTPGETIWVDVELSTPGTNGGFVDAADTLVTHWDNPANLVPAFAVPEPATLMLIVCAGLFAFVARRREQSRLVP